MSSQDEYVQTRRIPDGLQIQGGPDFIREPFIEIVGGLILWTWTSAGGSYRIVYGQSPDPDVPRGVMILGARMPPEDAAHAMAQACMPDSKVKIFSISSGKDKAGAIMLTQDLSWLERPGAN